MNVVGRFRALSVVALASAVVLTGCSSSTPDAEPSQGVSSPQAPQASAAPQVPVGLEFTAIEGDNPLDEDAYYAEFVAAGALWFAETTQSTSLITTANGIDWETIDLTAHGLPAEASFRSAQFCRADPVVDARDDGFTTVYYTYTGGSHPQGLGYQMWLVDIEGGDVTVTPGAAVGLETMPAPEGGLAFRTDCIEAFVEIDGKRAAVGQGQWWKDYETGRVNNFVATEGADGTWSVYSTRASEFLGADGGIDVEVVAQVGGTTVAVGNVLGKFDTFDVWVTGNGRDWEMVADAFGGADLGRLFDAAVTEHGITLVTGEEAVTSGEATLWSSADGRSWTATPLGGGKWFTVGRVLKVGASYLVPVEYDVDDEGVLFVWEAGAGGAWTLREDSADFARRLVNAHSMGDGLVAVSGSTLYVSGNPWG